MEPGSRLSVGQVFDAQAAQATFERLVNAINAQAADVERLTRRVATLETTQRHAVAAQHHALQQTDAIVAQLETLQDTQIQCGREQRGQQSQLDDVVLVVSRDAKRWQAMEDRTARLEKELEMTQEKMQHDVAPIELVVRLQEDQYAVHDRIATVETRVDAKMDKSEMSRLDGVVAKIQAFAPTATQLSTRVRAIEENSMVIQGRLHDEQERTARLRQEIQSIHSELELKVDAAEWRACKDECQTAIDRLEKDAAATSAVADELVHRGVALDTGLRTLSSKLASVAAAIAKQLETLEAHMKSELDKKLDRLENGRILKEIQHELTCKAWRKDTQQMGDNLNDLTIQFDDVKRHLALCTRFLDWYASRGESYERNLDVVEKQLERLAHASAPQFRQPFEDQVRFSE